MLAILWYRLNNKGEFLFNHLDTKTRIDTFDLYPLPINGQNWGTNPLEWKKEIVMLTPGRCPNVIHL